MTLEELAAIVQGIAPAVRALVTREHADLLRRILQLEAAPPGRDGRDGAAGRDGKDGAPGAAGAPGIDGIGFDDFTESYDGDRTLVHTYRAADGRTKEFRHVLPLLIYREVWTPTRAYERGDCVTYGGALWHCNLPTTTRPGDGAAGWTLIVKRGDRGRDGKDGRP